MVYLALTALGLQEILEFADAANTHVWCSADALSHAEFAKLERANVTRFTCAVPDGDKASIQAALATIEEHHPGERVWIEGAVFWR